MIYTNHITSVIFKHVNCMCMIQFITLERQSSRVSIKTNFKFCFPFNQNTMTSQIYKIIFIYLFIRARHITRNYITISTFILYTWWGHRIKLKLIIYNYRCLNFILDVLLFIIFNIIFILCLMSVSKVIQLLSYLNV